MSIHDEAAYNAARDDARAEAESARQYTWRRSLPVEHPLHIEPRHERVGCSQCGGTFGPADHGYSTCGSHSGRLRLDTQYGYLP